MRGEEAMTVMMTTGTDAAMIEEDGDRNRRTEKYPILNFEVGYFSVLLFHLFISCLVPIFGV